MAIPGPLPVIFITTTPEDCMPCEHPAKVLLKPMHEPTIVQASWNWPV